MAKSSKVLFFEYTIGVMMLAYQISKNSRTVAYVKKEIDEVFYDKEKITKLLDEIALNNDFSRTKSFGLLYRFLNGENEKYGFQFDYIKLHGIYYLDSVLFDHYDVKVPEPDDCFDFYPGKVRLCENMQPALALLIFDPSQSIIADKLKQVRSDMFVWLDNQAVINGLHSGDLDFKPNRIKPRRASLFYVAR